MSLVNNLPPEGAYQRARGYGWVAADHETATTFELLHGIYRAVAALGGSKAKPLEIKRPGAPEDEKPSTSPREFFSRMKALAAGG